MQTAKRIDMHTHAFPLAFLEHLQKVEPGVAMRDLPDGRRVALWNKAPLPVFSLEERLASMDAEGVASEVLSAPPVYGRFGPETANLCARMNDLQGEIADAAPGRFHAFVHLPYHDRGKAEAELRRLEDDPRFVGVTLASNINGAYPGAELEWLWPALCERDFPVFVHPVAPAGAQSPISLPLVHFPSDTTVFASTLILSGVMERYPALKVILAHYGGSLSVLGSRLDMIAHPHFPSHMGADLPQRPSAYVRRFYVDTAQGFDSAAFVAALEAFGASHLLYGSDYFLLDTPWRDDLNRFLDPRLEGLGLGEAVRAGNARSLLRYRSASNSKASEVVA